METTGKHPAGPPGEVEAVMREAVLAAGDQQQYLTFLLGEEMFAIGILSIREIIEYGHLTEVPMTPPFIRGVINLRGAVVPVVDLAIRFGRPPRDTTKRTCIVIIEIESVRGRQEMGIVVDTVSEVLEIPAEDIEPPPEFGARIRIDFIAGMGKVGGSFVVILDVDRVLSVDEVAVVANATARAASRAEELRLTSQKNKRPKSISPKISTRNSGSMSANSTAAAPCWFVRSLMACRRQSARPYRFSWFLTFVNSVDRPPPSAVTAAMIATAIRATRSAYSTAVAPSSRASSVCALVISFNISSTPR